MATFENLLDPITNIDDTWDGHRGLEVEDFITKRFKKPLGETINYSSEDLMLTLYNPEGEPIASGKVTVVPPNYSTVVTFPQITVNNVVYNNNIEVNYTSSATFVAGINVKTFYESTGTFYNLSNKVDVTFLIEGTTDRLVVNITPNKMDDDTLQPIDITPLFLKNRQGAKIKAIVTANGVTGEEFYPGTITIHKIELSAASTYASKNKVVFNILGLRNILGMYLYYYPVKLGSDLNVSVQELALTESSTVTLTLPSTGAYLVIARISNREGTFFSNWVLANVVGYDPDVKEPVTAIIGGIPETINNCENANLYKIIYVPGFGGDIEITSYLTDSPDDFLDENWDKYLFNQTVIQTAETDKEAAVDYYSYVELTSVGESQKNLAFKLKVDGLEYNIYSLLVDTKGNLIPVPYFTVNILENPYNINNAFNYTEGAMTDFSLITGHATSLFTDINPNIEASDGWTTDENLTAYKISGQNRDLFNTPKDLSALINSSLGFTIEVMLKNYNINGEDPVMNIGNLLFGPGYARVDSADKGDTSIYVNSRADFEKDVITHLLFVYDPSYKPNTYSNIYDLIFDEGGVTYSDISYTYPVLKVFVNGSINREILLDQNFLKKDNGFNLLICPQSSDLNLYIFRTYTRALNYAEILKNFISSRSTSLEKKEIYDRNDILGEDGRISFYKSMLNHNVIVFVLPSYEKPLFFGNRKSAGDGVDSLDNKEKARVSVLVHYKDDAEKTSSGRFTGEKSGKSPKYKALGSSAKKYMFHNTQISKFTFLSEADIEAGKDQYVDGSTKYAVPTDPEGIKAKKLVGKVNYASSMQSHKKGAIQLFDNAYKEIFGKEKLYNGGKKACFEDAFMYFYYNVKDNSELDTITINDLYTTEVINGITVPYDSDVKFFGFQTWGSAKADDPTYGYGDHTPEYLLFEGADNASPGANFKLPWAAFQTWNSNQTKQWHTDNPGSMILQTKDVTASDQNPDRFTAGLLIEGETIKFENATDPLDVDYGLELIILDGLTEEQAEEIDLWKFTEPAKTYSLPEWVEFYNNCYLYDFTNIIPNPNTKKVSDEEVADNTIFDLTNPYDSTNKRIYMSRNNTILKEGDVETGTTAAALDLFRWDGIKNRWVPAGLHYTNDSWETFNLRSVYGELTNLLLYKDIIEGNPDSYEDVFDTSLSQISVSTVGSYVIPAFKEMFRANIEKYCDVDDIAYHLAFIRLVSGTDNRAKNTYFQIIGHIYEENEDGEWIRNENKGDYKIRLMLDDLDTILATNNNGQLVKPYYLMEPPFNKDTEYLWGDNHSSFFYPFDVCYASKVHEYLGKLINHLVGGTTSIKATNTNLYNYFFSVLKQFPEIAYNHHAEIYYEVPQTLFHDLVFTLENGLKVFPQMLDGFANNGVLNPLSLSHGRCLESEYQFVKDRLLLLGTSTATATGLYGTETPLSTLPTGDAGKTVTFNATATFTDYIYPLSNTKGSQRTEYLPISTITNRSETSINYDPIFDTLEELPINITNIVTPDREFNISSKSESQITYHLSTASKYKSLTVNGGLDFVDKLLNLPNAKSLIIDGSLTNYKVTLISIIVKDHLPIIEHLEITNTKFESVLDLRGCNRLHTLDLRGSSGISDIIFPENNRLTTVYLPSGLKNLTLGKNPSLSTFVFAEGTQLTKLSLDCSSFNESFDYMDILLNRIDYSNLEQFILRNTPEGGLKITEEVASRLASVKLNTNSLISGKYIITDRTALDNGNITYTWGTLTNISYNTKKYLVTAFGNIDSETNLVYFDYLDTTLVWSSRKLANPIAIDAPNGGTFKPFDSLYFTEGNNVGITEDGRLNITYRVSGLSYDSKTGAVTIPSSGNTGQYYNYTITVTLTDGSKLLTITGEIYSGYIEPAIGDFAYSDGTFSASYNSDKTLVGLVFLKEVVEEGELWDLGILSNGSITDYSGPSYYKRDSSGNFGLNDTYLGEIEYFMRSSDFGLNLTMSDTSLRLQYLGINTANELLPNENDNLNTLVDYNYLSENPSTLIKDSGKSDTETLAKIGKDRLKTIMTKTTYNDLLSQLLKLGFVDTLREFTESWDSDSFREVSRSFNEAVLEVFDTSADYYKVLHPLALRTSIFEPKGLTGIGKEYYAKGNWYIPSMKEIELLIWYRIRSTTKSTTSNSLSYWNGTSYTVGNSIFSDKNIYFLEFLGDDNIKISSRISYDNSNVVYHLFNGSYSSSPKYGWFSLVNKNSPNSTTSREASVCRRDIALKITPCCTIRVTKNL